MMRAPGYEPRQVGPPTASVFDPATVITPIVLSNANATASRSVSTGNAAANVKGANGHASGKWYLRYNVVSASGGITMGLGFATATSAGFVGGSINSFALYDNHSFYQSGSAAIYGPGFTTGDLIEWCVDVTGGLAWYRVNGGTWSNGGDPATNIAGIPVSGFSGALFPAVEEDTPGTANSVTLDTGTSSPIAGFTAWG